jgi:hypothetical protein
MTSEEIKHRRDDQQEELQKSIRSVRAAWQWSRLWTYAVRFFGLVFATAVACEPFLRRHICSETFWDLAPVGVLLLLLLDLGLRPAEAMRAHQNYIGEAEILARGVSWVDPELPDAVAQLQAFNQDRKRLMEKHRIEGA